MKPRGVIRQRSSGCKRSGLCSAIAASKAESTAPGSRTTTCRPEAAPLTAAPGDVTLERGQERGAACLAAAVHPAQVLAVDPVVQQARECQLVDDR